MSEDTSDVSKDGGDIAASQMSMDVVAELSELIRLGRVNGCKELAALQDGETDVQLLKVKDLNAIEPSDAALELCRAVTSAVGLHTTTSSENGRCPFLTLLIDISVFRAKVRRTPEELVLFEVVTAVLKF